MKKLKRILRPIAGTALFLFFGSLLACPKHCTLLGIVFFSFVFLIIFVFAFALVIGFVWLFIED